MAVLTGAKKTTLKTLVIILSSFSMLISCQKDIWDTVSITTTTDGSQFYGAVSGNVRLRNYKSGFRVIDKSNPLQPTYYFCQYNMNKTEFTQNLQLAKNSTYNIAAVVVECDANMKTTGESLIGNEITITK